MNSHLKVAHEHGVKTALQQCGYDSTDAVQKDAQELGLLQDATPAKTASENEQLATLKALLR